jgi:hypothetical protein
MEVGTLKGANLAEAFPNICQNCPAARGLIALCERFDAKPVCDIEKESYRDHTINELDKLDEAAATRSCNQTIKELPAAETEVPQIGTDYCNFVKQCFAYPNYKNA